MIVDAADAARVEHLEDLPILVPDPARADRARRRCRALLARQRRRGDRVARRADTARRGVVLVIVATVCVLFVVYLTALVATAIRVRAGV